jgi:hypothetical protein
LVRRVFGDDVPFPHEADIALCGTFLDVQDLLQLLAKVYVGNACLPPEDVPCDIHQFSFLALLLFLTGLLTLVHVHPCFLVPCKEHQRHVQRASVPYFQGFQDYSQLTRDYGDKESRVIQNTVGNVFSGQVVGETAKILSERFGKVLQKRQSMTINQREKSTSISTQMDSLIPASKISNLTQGMFVGAVADNFDERIEQKIFHCEIVVDNEKVKRETARYVKLPQIIDFTDKDGNDRMQEEIQANYDRIRQEVRQIVEDEITRIKNDPELCHLIREEE